jgi:hypothetical protein
MRNCRLLIWIFSISVALLFPIGSSATGPSIEFLDTQPLIFTMGNDGRMAKATITVRNAGDTLGFASFCMFFQNKPSAKCEEIVRISDGEDQVAKNGALRTMSIFVDGTQLSPPDSGYLVLETYEQRGGAKRASSLRQFRLNSAPFPARAGQIVGVAFLLAMMIAIGSIAKAKRDNKAITAWSPMGLGNWDFTRSWASNVAVGGAFLSTVLALSVLPDQTKHLSRTAYAILNVLFALLAGSAPLLFNFARKPILHNDQGGVQVEYQGFVFFFLLASAATICAAVGQMLTVMFLIGELSDAGLIAKLLGGVLQIFIVILVGGLCVYAAVTIYSTVESQISAPSPPMIRSLQSRKAMWPLL